MEAFSRGDETAFDHLVVEYQLSVYHYILRTVRDTGRAEDLTQEVFVRVFKARSRYRPTAKFRTWLFTIAHRLSLNEIRAERRRRKILAAPGAGDSEGRDLVATAESVGDETVVANLERQELENVVESLLAGLPPNQQAAFRLLTSEKFSYEEIAEVLGVSTGAVKSLLVRGRETLRRGVEAYLTGGGESARSDR